MYWAILKRLIFIYSMFFIYPGGGVGVEFMVSFNPSV